MNDTVRLLSRRRLWVLTAVVAIAGAIMIVNGARSPFGQIIEGRDGSRVIVYNYATAATAAHVGALDLMALVLPLALGDSLARDRRSRYVALLVSRGASRLAVFVAWVVAGLLVSATTIAVVLGAWLATATVVTPRWHGPVGAVVTHGGALLDSQPLLYFLLVIAVSSLACGATVASCYALSIIAASPPICVLVPPLILLIGIWIPNPRLGDGTVAELLTTLNPAVRAQFLSSPFAWAGFAPSALYWTSALTCLLVAGSTAYRCKEAL